MTQAENVVRKVIHLRDLLEEVNELIKSIENVRLTLDEPDQRVDQG